MGVVYFLLPTGRNFRQLDAQCHVMAETLTKSPNFPFRNNATFFLCLERGDDLPRRDLSPSPFSTFIFIHRLTLFKKGKMSRPSSVAQRSLTLTEELEKLEQSITLTLQGKQPRPRLSGRAGIDEAKRADSFHLPGRNRSKFQSGTSDSHNQSSSHC